MWRATFIVDVHSSGPVVRTVLSVPRGLLFFYKRREIPRRRSNQYLQRPRIRDAQPTDSPALRYMDLESWNPGAGEKSWRPGPPAQAVSPAEDVARARATAAARSWRSRVLARVSPDPRCVKIQRIDHHVGGRTGPGTCSSGTDFIKESKKPNSVGMETIGSPRTSRKPSAFFAFAGSADATFEQPRGDTRRTHLGCSAG